MIHWLWFKINWMKMHHFNSARTHLKSKCWQGQRHNKHNVTEGQRDKETRRKRGSMRKSMEACTFQPLQNFARRGLWSFFTSPFLHNFGQRDKKPAYLIQICFLKWQNKVEKYQITTFPYILWGLQKKQNHKINKKSKAEATSCCKENATKTFIKFLFIFLL